jgi:signal transduction histidine kinase
MVHIANTTSIEDQRVARAEQLRAISTALSLARTENELLEAIAEYARNTGALDFGLMHINFDGSGEPYEAVFSASIGPHSDPIMIGRVIPISQLPYFFLDKEHLDRLLVFNDFNSDPRINGVARGNQEATGIRSGIIMPLVSAGELIGAVSILWQEPRTFGEQEVYVYSQVSPIIASVFARLRAYRVEQELRHERELLFEASADINEANSYDEIVQAVEKLDLTPGDVHLTLMQHDDLESEHYYHVVAASDRQFKVRGLKLKQGSVPIFESHRINAVYVIEDTQDHLALDDVNRLRLTELGIRFVAGYPLLLRGRTLGALSLVDSQPHHLSLRDRRVFEAIGRLVAAAVERVRLQEETTAAKEESEFLYRLSQDFNAATTYQELMDAIARLQPDCDAVFLNLFENLDYDRATYLEVTAGTALTYTIQGEFGVRIPLTKYPIGPLIRYERFWAIEDIDTDGRLDPVTYATWKEMDIRALMCVNLFRVERYLGLFFFEYKRPHYVSAREQRLTLGIADLTLAAVERILAQQQLAIVAEAQRSAYLAEQAARSDVEMLYRASEAVNAATNFQAVLRAVEPLAPDVDRLHLFLWEGLDFRNAAYFEPVATISRIGESAAPLGTHLAVEQYPVADQVASTRQLVIESIHTHPQVDPITRANWEAVGIQALLLVPLIQDERWYGTVSFESLRPRTFSERDRRLTLAISDLVASAVVRIASQMETQQAEEEAAFLYQFAQEVNSATSIQEVADAVLRAYSSVEGVYIQTWEHLDYHRASHYTIDGAAVRGDTLVADRGSIYHKATLPNFYERVRREGIWMVEDVDTDERIDPWLRQVYASINVRATLVLPMLQGERWLASISFRYSKPYSYSPRDLRLMRGIRDVVFSAVERIQSQEAMRQAYLAEQDARAESEALYRVSEDINAATTFHDIVRAVHKLDFGPGDIYLNLFENYNYEGARYFDIVATANDAFDHEGERWWISEFSLVHKFPRQGVFINENIPENPNIDEASKQQFLRLGVKSNMRVSLSLHGRWMGGLGLDSALPRSYSEREKRLMAGVGDLVAAAVERIRLQEESEEAHHRAQELAALEERNRLARELHDSVSQALYGIGLGARTAQAMWENDKSLVKESIDYVLTLAEAALVEMRALIFELRPESLENEGLVTVLAKQAASLQTRHGLQVLLELCEEPSLPLDVKESLFRVAREALHNIIKHAGAKQVTLRLKLTGEQLLMQIIDDGAGFDVRQDFRGHLGLRSMQERIQQLGGSFDLQSAFGQGTRLTVTLR